MRERIAGEREGPHPEGPQKRSIDECIAFGEELIRTLDLDPVYVAIYGASLPEEQTKRLLLAYSCFYHLGASARISEMEGSDFWDLMWVAAYNNPGPSADGLPGDNWPRGSERRHFRGDKCVKAVERLAQIEPEHPERLIDSLIQPLRRQNAIQLATVMGRVKVWPMFGEWIGFKLADLFERLLGVQIEFPENLALIYKEPRAALDMIKGEPTATLQALINHFSSFPAPPGFDRSCNVQEAETCMCKWRSHVHGSYWVGKDIHEIRKGLRGWGRTADRLLGACPAEIERGASL